MQTKGLREIQGIVKVKIYAGNKEKLINVMAQRHIEVWNMAFDGEELTMEVLLKDFFRLRPLLKQTGCRMHVLERKGFPFYMKRLLRRKAMIIGVIFFIAGLYILTSLVWEVHVEGNEQISEEKILQAAKKHGLYPFQWSFKLDEPDELAESILSELPGVSWITVRKEGTQVYIKVVESTLREEERLNNPRHLVSSSDAVITEIFAERGVPKVKINSRVKKGDILISGILGDEENQEIVVAEGRVKGLVWHTMEVEVPLETTVKTYTGEKQKRFYLIFGNKGLKLSGFGEEGYSSEEKLRDRKMISWRNWKFPIGWMNETVMETENMKNTRTVEEAKQIGLQQARAKILLLAGENSKITEEKILHEKIESGKVYMKVFFEVEQHIEQEQAIIQINQGE